MLYLKILDKSGNQKAFFKGFSIDERIDLPLKEGDKISVRLDGCFFLGIKINEMKESILYLPKKSFEFTVPSQKEITGGYDKDCFKEDYNKIKQLAAFLLLIIFYPKLFTV